MDNNNWNNDWNSGYDPNFGTEPQKTYTRSTKSSKNYVTKTAFVLGLIFCMFATSALTVGGLYFSGALKRLAGSETSTVTTNEISATNYTLAAATGNQKSVEEIVAMNENAVVEIQTESLVTDVWMMNYVTQGAGSGVIISSDGYILTCNHVIEGAKTITVSTKDGTSYDATFIGGDATTDVAVLKIEGTGFTAVTYGDSDSLTVGDLAVAIGNPLGRLGGSASVGIISSQDRELVLDGQVMNLLQTDASINPGNSGGGLFDGEGNLIGVVVAKSSGSDIEGLGFAIPINTAAEIAKEIIENGKVVGRALIGVTIIDATSAEVARQYDYSMPGLYIYDVQSEEAKAAGLQKDDMITAINGVSLSDRSDLTTELRKYSPGDTITLTIVRGNKTMDIDTVLTEAN